MTFFGTRTLRAVLGLTAVAAAGAGEAATIDLSGKNWVTYGDGNSYSLPLNGLEVMSGPGQIDLYTKLGLGANGQLGNPPAGMDDAFDTPSANTVAGFRMSAANEPGGAVAEGSWDRIGWWDSTLTALHGAIDLNQNSMVFFFANNETGGAGTDNLAGWARLELVNHVTNELWRFDFTNNNSNYGPPPVGGGVPLGNPALFTSTGAAPGVRDFVMSGGEVCLDALGELVSCAAPHVLSAEHNLGGDRAAYAVVFPELDALIANAAKNGTLANYSLHVDYRLGCGAEGAFPTVQQGGRTLCDPTYALNGGDEKVFIGTQALQELPEPSSIALAALALLGCVGLRRRPRH